jgi:hypothetical protein
MLTFEEFLAATRWGDAARSYEDGIRFDGPLPPARREVVSGAVHTS